MGTGAQKRRQFPGAPQRESQTGRVKQQELQSSKTVGAGRDECSALQR